MSAPVGADSEKRAIHRQLKIKVGAAKRLLKEHNLYSKEAKEQQTKVDRMVAENGDEWEIRSARRIVDESHRMIKDSGDRLEKVAQELQTLVDSVKTKPEFAEDYELLEAVKELAGANAAVVANKASREASS